MPEKPKEYTKIPNFGKSVLERKFPYYSREFVKKVDSLDIDEQIPLTPELRNMFGLKQSTKTSITKEEFLHKEWDFWANGFWWYNKDKLEYITGYHYMTLQYWLITVKDANGKTAGTTNPKFVDMHRDRQYCVDFIMNYPHSTGLLYVGCRRSGKTAEMGALAYFDTMTQFKGFCSVQSKTDDDSVLLFQEHIVTPWRYLPNFLKPLDNKSRNPTKEFLATPQSKKQSEDGEEGYHEHLESRIKTFNAGETAVDGRRSTFMINDEYGKTIAAKVSQRHDKNIECTVLGSDIFGFAYWSTTVEELTRKGGQEAKILWDDADTSDKNLDGDGRTQNYLSRLFFPAYYGMFEGKNLKTGKPLIDEWGYSDIKSAIEFLDSREKGKSESKLLELRRKYPRTIDDVFRIALSQSPYNTDKLKAHKLHNEEQFESTNRTKWVKGNFEWKDGIPFREVEWRPNPNGRWKMLALPPDHMRNKWTKSPMGLNEKAPAYNLAISSLDPFAYSEISDSTKEGSMAASHVMMYHGNPEVPTIVCQYYYRTKTVQKMWEDILKQCIFYSSPLAVERTTAASGFIPYLETNGYGDYVMPNPLSTSRGIERGFPSSKSMQERLMGEGVNYVETYVGYNDKQLITTEFVFDELIDDLINFNPDKWTPHDLTVSFMHCVMGWNYRNEYYKKSKVKNKFNSSEQWFGKRLKR